LLALDPTAATGSDPWQQQQRYGSEGAKKEGREGRERAADGREGQYLGPHVEDDRRA
jgi:hypothetical protein